MRNFLISILMWNAFGIGVGMGFWGVFQLYGKLCGLFGRCRLCDKKRTHIEVVE